MRADLERMRLIEQYLNNELSLEERAGFESQLENDASLREELQMQRDLQGGIARGGIRRSVTQAGQRFHRRNLIKKALIGGAAAVIIASAGSWLLTPAHQVKASPAQPGFVGTGLPELNEAGRPEWAMADSVIPAQIFNIDPSKDTVIQTSGGMVLAIDAGSFVDKAGKRTSGTVSLCLKEALNASTIMTAGLSTSSDDKLLETGGMFFVDARNTDGILNIDPAHPIYAEIPSKDAKPGMMLFKGQRLPNGTINWTDPKPLPKDLMPVPISSLDFYPPEYLPALAEKGYSTSDRRFTDSVYYSMAKWFATDGSRANLVGLSVKDSISETDTLSDVYVQDRAHDCGINPASIKAIRSERFESTLIATREFAQRLRLIHQAHSQYLLDLYVNNPDRNLYEIDSMAARQESRYAADFARFAARRPGKVRNGSKQFAMLREFYARQTKLFTEAIAKTQESIRAKAASRDREFQQRSRAHDDSDWQRSADLFADELGLNLTDAYRQLGYAKPPLVIIDPITAAARIPSTGWYNVDKYVLEATTNRESMEYTDPASGKKATLRYEPLQIEIADKASYGKVLAYLLPDKLNAFMRLGEADGRFSEKLNSLVTYDLVVLGYRGNQRFILTQRSIKAGSLTGLKLHAADSAAFTRELSAIKSFGSAMSLRDEAAFQHLSLLYAAELKERTTWNTLMQSLREILFPCLERRGVNPGAWKDSLYSEPIPDQDWGRGYPPAPRQ